MSKDSRQASREAKRIWERLYTVQKNEEAWEILDEELDSLQCHCRIGKKYRIVQEDEK